MSLSWRQLQEIVNLKDVRIQELENEVSRIKKLENEVAVVEDLKKTIARLEKELAKATGKVEDMKSLVETNKTKFDRDVSRLSKTLKQVSKSSDEMMLRRAQEQFLSKKTRQGNTR